MDTVRNQRVLLQSASLTSATALHELDPAFRKVTLENERIRAVAQDLQFHHDPVGRYRYPLNFQALTAYTRLALQSMLIFKQPEIGGEGTAFVFSRHCIP